MAVGDLTARRRSDAVGRVLRWMYRLLPKGLYARSLIIVIAPMVLLQSVIAYTFMERHWQLVTTRLSSAVAGDIAMLIDIYQSYPQQGFDAPLLVSIASRKLGLDVEFLPPGPLPPPMPPPLFDILDSALSNELRQIIVQPFWTDTIGKASLVEVRVQLDTAIMRVVGRRSQAYASNAHIFLVWMVSTSLVLILVAVLFLRNQIRPIQRLASAAESFGKGRDVDFRPRGAREVRAAGHAFIEMRRRVERAMEQRTTMLNGVSHDLRTVLTRFRLSLEVLPDGPELDDLRRDVDEMGRMLEAYLAFARGDAGEQAMPTDLKALLEEFRADCERQGHATNVSIMGEPTILVRRDGFRRLLGNLVSNAARFGDRIEINAVHDERWLVVTVDDDGPGIPEDKRQAVFRPFLRLDEARNLDHAGTGLGLAIARDIARSHGGDVSLADSPMGGLRAIVRLPA